MAEISEVRIQLGRLLSVDVSPRGLTFVQHSGQEQFGSAHTDRVSLSPEQWRDLAQQLQRLDATGWLLPVAPSAEI